MQVVIPMSGRGARFARAGYAEIKPLIEVEGMPIIEHVVRLFPGETDFVFVCAADHLEHTPLRRVLHDIAPAATIMSIEPHKEGPVHAVLLAAAHIDDTRPVVVNYCDFSCMWDWSAFKESLRTLQWDGCVAAYRGFHPHLLGPDRYAAMSDADGWMIEIREKGQFHEDKMLDWQSSGTYAFRTGALLERTFREAVARDLRTNGELYCSTPFNLLREWGLRVRIFEVERFLQWGTPADLEEYLGRSRFFAEHADWEPEDPPMPGTTLVPMAGAGSRFEQEGYTVPKPMIEVGGTPMITRSLRSLVRTTHRVCVVRPEHVAHPGFTAALSPDGRPTAIHVLDHLTEGQAITCLEARARVDPALPLLIAPCDAAVVYDERAWRARIADAGVDAVVWTFRNHPHANRNPHQYGWVRTSGAMATGISCKQPLGDDVTGDPGIIGVFWFRRAQLFFDATERLVANNVRINGEFYVDMVLQTALEMGHRVAVFDVEHMVCFGTPDDVRTFEYWEQVAAELPHHPYRREAEGP